jgi:hypothetical protein
MLGQQQNVDLQILGPQAAKGPLGKKPPPPPPADDLLSKVTGSACIDPPCQPLY